MEDLEWQVRNRIQAGVRANNKKNETQKKNSKQGKLVSEQHFQEFGCVITRTYGVREMTQPKK
jgi:hypothetical protein